MRSSFSMWTLIEGGPVRLGALLAVAWLLVTIQSVISLHPSLRVDLGTLVIVYFALENAPLSGAVASLLVGYLADVFSGESRGLTSAAMVVGFVIVRLLVVRFTGARFWMITLVSLIGTTLVFFARLLIEGVFGPGFASWEGMSPGIPSLLIGAALFGYPCYRLLRAVDDRFHQRDDEVTHFRTLLPRR